MDEFVPANGQRQPLSSTGIPVTGGGLPTVGQLAGEFPYVRVGAGSESLVVLPGFGDAMLSGRYPPASGWALLPYFTSRVLRETADGIPNARQVVVPGARHGAFRERKPLFDSHVREFLAESE